MGWKCGDTVYMRIARYPQNAQAVMRWPRQYPGQKRDLLSGCCHTVVLMQLVTKDSLRSLHAIL